MKSKILSTASSPSANPMISIPMSPLFVRRFANAAAARARATTDPLGDLWSPRLLDRLHAPVTRFRY